MARLVPSHRGWGMAPDPFSKGGARKRGGVVVVSEQVAKAPPAIEEEFTPAVRAEAQKLISVEAHQLLRESKRM